MVFLLNEPRQKALKLCFCLWNLSSLFSLTKSAGLNNLFRFILTLFHNAAVWV